MSIGQRLRRLEGIAHEELVYEQARRMAEELGGDIEATTIELAASYQRIARYGIEAEIRLMARESGKSEDEVRAEIDAEVDKMQRESRSSRPWAPLGPPCK